MAAPRVRDDGSDEQFQRVQELQERLEAVADPVTRELADALVAAIVQMYGDGLARIVELLLLGGEESRRIAAALADDPLVAALLLIHDLHPVPLEDRVREALARVRPYMESHGGDVQLLSLQHGVARLRLRGSCSDCSASAVTLELAIKQALEETAPDLEGLEVEGVADPVAAGAGGFALPMVNAGRPPVGAGPPLVGAGPPPVGAGPPLVGAGPPLVGAGPPLVGAGPPRAAVGGGMALPMALAAPPTAVPAPSWLSLDDGAGALGPGETLTAQIAGEQLLVANVDGTLLAYRDVCPGCGSALHAGELAAGALSCPTCTRTFFLPRAGRSMDDERLQLAPVPLLREEGHVKVALAL